MAAAPQKNALTECVLHIVADLRRESRLFAGHGQLQRPPAESALQNPLLPYANGQ